jgi:thioredoxin reductase (NADPH)
VNGQARSAKGLLEGGRRVNLRHPAIDPEPAGLEEGKGMADVGAFSVLDGRYRQMFPVLTAAQVETVRRFAGPPRRYEAGTMIYGIGDRRVSALLVLGGELEIRRADALGHDLGVTRHGVGEFSGELGQLSGRPAMAETRAGPGGCELAPLEADGLRRLVVASAEIGELLMRAFILRRVALLETGAGGPVLVGAAASPDMARLRTFLTRNGYPHVVLDPAVDADGAQVIARFGVEPRDLPLVVFPHGALLRNPSEAELAGALGIVPELTPDKLYDVVVVGAGPAGLAAAVYATSEGLSTLVLDCRAIGGQAGASARIENYLGFPTGISGRALAGRAVSQAPKFGAVVAIPEEAGRLDCAAAPETSRDAWTLGLSDGKQVRGRAVVVASGAEYRRPAIPGLEASEGRGVHYWASALEAKLCAGEEIALVGGGNSAGQAVVFLAGQARKVHLIVRRDGLQATMSRYLIDRIGSLPNVELHTLASVTALEQDAEGALAGVRWRRQGGEEQGGAIRHLFLFVGADPNTRWLADCGFALDEKGFMLTGRSLEASDLVPFDWRKRRPWGLETNRPGVFAIGDVRSGSTKRVASAVGEGAQVVAQIHAYLAL